MAAFSSSGHQVFRGGSEKNRVLILILILALVFPWAVINIHDRIGQEDAVKDFIAYWSSVRLLIMGKNPYGSVDLQLLQQSVGWSGPEPLIPYNPPSILTYLLPFSAENYVVCKLFWLLFMMSLSFIGVHLLWKAFEGKEELRFLSVLLLGTFSPFYFMIAKGQIVPIVLVGLAGFLYFQKENHDLLAGIFASFIAVKPHVVYLFWIVFLLWLIRCRRWHIFTGAAVGYLAAALVPLLLKPDVFLSYFEAMRSLRGAYHWATPAYGTYLRLFAGGDKEWLQFLPMVVGVSWLLFYWRRKRASWNWIEQTPLLLTVSIMTSFYCWVNDYALLLVPLMYSIVILTNRSTTQVPWLFLQLYILMNGVALVEYIRYPGEHHFIWFPACVLLLCFIAMKSVTRQHQRLLDCRDSSA